MGKRNGFLTFLTALVPGIGYMYLGLLKKGIQFFALYILITPVFRILGISILAWLVKLPIWFYTFFDTFNVASKLDRGEHVEDTDYIFDKLNNGSYDIRFKTDKKFIITIAWILIAVGILAIFNTYFSGTPLYNYIKVEMAKYIFPSLLILGGIFVLLRSKR